MPGMHIILSEIIIMIYVMSEHWYLGTPKSVSSLVHWLLNLWFFFSMIKIECHLFVIQYICFAFHRIHYIWLASINGQSAFIALSHRIKSKSFEYSNRTKRSMDYCIGSSNSRSSSSIFIHFFFKFLHFQFDCHRLACHIYINLFEHMTAIKMCNQSDGTEHRNKYNRIDLQRQFSTKHTVMIRSDLQYCVVRCACVINLNMSEVCVHVVLCAFWSFTAWCHSRRTSDGVAKRTARVHSRLGSPQLAYLKRTLDLHDKFV